MQSWMREQGCTTVAGLAAGGADERVDNPGSDDNDWWQDYYSRTQQGGDAGAWVDNPGNYSRTQQGWDAGAWVGNPGSGSNDPWSAYTGPQQDRAAGARVDNPGSGNNDHDPWEDRRSWNAPHLPDEASLASIPPPCAAGRAANP